MTKPFVIPKSLVWEAFQRVKDNGGSAGIDDELIAEFERNIGDNLYKLWNRMGSGSYFPPPVKAVPIPKKSGGTRMLGVPTVADRVAQTVVKLVLEPVLEPVFDRDSFGYRPGRSALDAVALVSQFPCNTIDRQALDVREAIDRAMKQVFGSMPRCRIAMETGTHSPWVSRFLTPLGHEVIVGHTQKVRLITKSRRKDDRLDARTLARLAIAC